MIISPQDNERFTAIENRLAQLESQVRLLSTGSPAADAPLSKTSLPSGGALPPPPTEASRVGSGADLPGLGVERAPRRSFEIEGERFLRWAGVGLVVLAVGFAVSTAIGRGWIGAELQLIGALVVSLGLIVAGLGARPTRMPWAHALNVGGVLALTSTVASSLFVGQFEESVALGCTAAVGVSGYLLANRVPSQWVGGSALIAPIIGWLIITEADPPYLISLGWMSLAIALGLILSTLRGWFVMRLTAHTVAGACGIAYAIGAHGMVRELLVLLGGILVFASIASVPSLGASKSVWRELELQLALLAPPWGLLILVLTFDIESRNLAAAVAVGVALGTGVCALVVRSRVALAHFVSLVVGGSITLSIGLALALKSPGTFAAFAVQAAGLVILARFLPSNRRVLLHAGILAVLSGAGIVSGLVDAWSRNAPIGEDVVAAMGIVVLGLGSWQARRDELVRLGFLAILAMVLLWLGSVLVHLPQGQALVSLSWAALGTLVLAAGVVSMKRPLGVAGLSIIGLTVAKLLSVDLQEVDALWRSGLFFVIGMGILRLGFLMPNLSGPDRRK